MRAIDMTGKRIGLLTVIGRAGTSKDGKATWLCRCDCGRETVVAGAELRHGGQKSCGCHQQEWAAAARRKHGLSRTDLYYVWRNMINRCEWPGVHNYHRYGGRGIKVCDEWRRDFNAFAEWALANGYQKGLQIDRIDNDGDYEPSNCRFVTPAENNRNKSSRKLRRCS